MNAKQLRNIAALARDGLVAACRDTNHFPAVAIAELAADLDACERAAIEMAKAEADAPKE